MEFDYKECKLSKDKHKCIEKAIGNLLGELWDSAKEISDKNNLHGDHQRIVLDELFIWLIANMAKHHHETMSKIAYKMAHKIEG